MAPTMDAYDRVPQEEDNDELSIEEQEAPKGPLELDIEEEEASSSDGLQLPPHALRRFTEPLWFISIGFSLVLVVPCLIAAIVITYSLVGRIWPATLFSAHLVVSLWGARDRIPTEDEDGIPLSRRCPLARRWIPPLLDIVLFGFLYAGITSALINYFFTEIDGEPVVEWVHYRSSLSWIRTAGLTIAGGRLVQESMSMSLLCYHRLNNYNLQDDPRLPRLLVTAFSRAKQQCYVCLPEQRQRRLRTVLRRCFAILTIASLVVLLWCIESMIVHVVSWPAPVQRSDFCDTLDETECFLPFPSFSHMVYDPTTATGWRVNLRSDVMPPLKGGLVMHPSFLNELDGFSTMAPLMFYLEGMKEADASGSGKVRLQGALNISLSTTNSSITLLLDVKEQKLVPHTAEIDHIDPKRPLVLVFPAKPLNHNTHYALAVVEATDIDGKRLPPTRGMQALQLHSDDITDKSDRRWWYKDLVVPALLNAAPWLDYDNDPDLLQLLFDFQTISAESQLGPVRVVRDATIKYIESDKWGAWNDHVRLVRQDDFDCKDPDYRIARTIHGELEVPWFIDGFGPGHRGSFLDPDAVTSGIPTMIGKAKFVVHIPCSLSDAAIRASLGEAEMRAVMEFGHGLFYNRGEASDSFLIKLADKNGFILTAMDWRGMSNYDLLVVVETLMSKPRQFQFVRDNLIQGYANKLALQHFSRHGMLELPWFKFHSRPIPLFGGRPPAYTFYGISQGGILGAGYTALSGPTGLIDRAVLGSPGTPFALIMTRSEAFLDYDAVLLLNFYNNRHIRVLLSLVQMAWDSVEGSGMLAAPIVEPFPPTLIQAGLGDATVSTIASEALARAYGASILPNNPRPSIYGIPLSPAANMTYDGPRVALTELIYQKEFLTLPVGDEFAQDNLVHLCVRFDPHLMKQVAEFICTGRVIDPCLSDGCRRNHVKCGMSI